MSTPLFAPFANGRPEILARVEACLTRQRGRDLFIVIDGLGADLLEEHLSYARGLRPMVRDGQRLESIMPSTTSSALTSYFTGVSPLEHGVLGYTTLDANGVAVNQLQGHGDIRAGEWRGGRTLGDIARERGRRIAHVGPARYRGSFFTEMLQPGWDFFGYRNVSDRVETVTRALRSVGADGLVYLHIPDVDKAGHEYGPRSSEWLSALEDIDYLVRSLMRVSPKGTRVSITSDHGMISANHSRIRDLASSPLGSGVTAAAGEGRALMLRCRDPESQVPVLRDLVGENGVVLDGTEILRRGVLGPADSSLHHPMLRDRLGDAMVIAHGDYQFTHTGFVPEASLAQRGVHGGGTDAECFIPWWETEI